MTEIMSWNTSHESERFGESYPEDKSVHQAIDAGTLKLGASAVLHQLGIWTFRHRENKTNPKSTNTIWWFFQTKQNDPPAKMTRPKQASVLRRTHPRSSIFWLVKVYFLSLQYRVPQKRSSLLFGGSHTTSPSPQEVKVGTNKIHTQLNLMLYHRCSLNLITVT